ncbi:hypothetical protein BC941DRAFT_411286 [Chlamydoabsidia padenii]|nr:hypothetical protein BC941DRAFT_411286 [Chlamydoabsidia padenii]
MEIEDKLGDSYFDHFDDTSQSTDTDEFDTLDADDFIDVFDNITDFEKEIGIDGDEGDSNEQSNKDERVAIPELHCLSKDTKYTTLTFGQPETASTTPNSNTANKNKTHATSCLSQTYSNTFLQQSHLDTFTSSWPSTFLPFEQDALKTPVSDHGDNISKWSATSTPSCQQQQQQPQLAYTDQKDVTLDPEAQEKNKQRQQRLNTLVDKRRQHFLRQQQTDNAQVPQLLDRIQKLKQQLDEHGRRQRTTRDKSGGKKMGLAMLKAIEAAASFGITTNQHTPPCHPTTLDARENPMTATQPDKPNDLDPEDPDPWTEECRHYLLLGRLKRAEYIYEKRMAKAQGINCPPPPIYNPTGLPRHNSDPLLSRHGAGLSVSGAALNAVASNSRTHPTEGQGRYHDGQASSVNTPYCGIKSSKLLVSNLPEIVTESTLRSFGTKDLISISLNTSNHTATLLFSSIESAVIFRRKYNRYLVGGHHIIIHFA